MEALTKHRLLSSGNPAVVVTDEKSSRYCQKGTVIGRNLYRGEGGYYDIVSFADGSSRMKIGQYRISEDE